MPPWFNFSLRLPGQLRDNAGESVRSARQIPGPGGGTRHEIRVCRRRAEAAGPESEEITGGQAVRRGVFQLHPHAEASAQTPPRHPSDSPHADLYAGVSSSSSLLLSAAQVSALILVRMSRIWWALQESNL